VSAQTCGFCHRPLLWAITVYDKPIPLDPDPDPEGNQFVYRDVSGALRARQRKKGQEPQPFERIHMPHVATCTARRKPSPPPSNVTSITAARSLQRGYRYPRRTP
jgi:hypothetical protein